MERASDERPGILAGPSMWRTESGNTLASLAELQREPLAGGCPTATRRARGVADAASLGPEPASQPTGLPTEWYPAVGSARTFTGMRACPARGQTSPRPIARRSLIATGGPPTLIAAFTDRAIVAITPGNPGEVRALDEPLIEEVEPGELIAETASDSEKGRTILANAASPRSSSRCRSGRWSRGSYARRNCVENLFADHKAASKARGAVLQLASRYEARGWYTLPGRRWLGGEPEARTASDSVRASERRR